MPDIASLFRHYAREIWGGTIIDQIEITVIYSEGAPLASLIYSGSVTTRAIGDMLVEAPRKVTLKISADASSLSDAAFANMLRHEALHLGYQHHDRNFIYVANKYGIPVSEHALRGGRVLLQVKQGARYVTIGEFDTETAAKRYYNDEYRVAHPGMKARLHF